MGVDEWRVYRKLGLFWFWIYGIRDYVILNRIWIGYWVLRDYLETKQF